MYLKRFPSGFSPGSFVMVKGYVHADPDRFSINLQSGPVVPLDIVSDIALHFNPRFDEETPLIVRNTKRNGYWGYEEREGGFFFSSEEPFCVHIYSEWRGYKIVVDDFPFIYYKHRHDLSTVTHLSVNGDVEVQEVSYHPAPKIKELFYVPKPIVPYKFVLDECLKPRSSVDIRGKIRGDIVRFSVNFVCGKNLDDDGLYDHPTVALHYDVRFQSNSIIRNTMVEGEWGEEETEGEFSFYRDSLFHLRFVCEEEHYKIFVDNILNAVYSHRINPRNVSYIYIYGELSNISVITS